MQRRLEGRTAIVTGAGGGLGRAHALYLAAQGANVIVNDLGVSVAGEGSNKRVADEVVAEIESMGGRAAVSDHDVSDWSAAEDMIQSAVRHFGDLHILVNNAGILRDRMLANMTENEWDSVIRVHLKGHAAATRHAFAYWREKAKSGKPPRASVIHTTSISGFAGAFGQANYAAAKMGIIGLSRVVSLEGRKYGIRSNAVSPSARTRIGMATPGSAERFPVPPPGEFDRLDPSNVSPLIAWLGEENCPADSQIFQIYGGRLEILAMPSLVHDLRKNDRWTPEDFDDRVLPLLHTQPTAEEFIDV